jgi:hypothetical protein
MPCAFPRELLSGKQLSGFLRIALVNCGIEASESSTVHSSQLSMKQTQLVLLHDEVLYMYRDSALETGQFQPKVAFFQFFKFLF